MAWRSYLAIAIVLGGTVLVATFWWWPDGRNTMERLEIAVGLVGIVGVFLGYYFGSRGLDAAQEVAAEALRGTIRAEDVQTSLDQALARCARRLDLHGPGLPAVLERHESRVSALLRRGVQVRLLDVDAQRSWTGATDLQRTLLESAAAARLPHVMRPRRLETRSGPAIFADWYVQADDELFFAPMLGTDRTGVAVQVRAGTEFASALETHFETLWNQSSLHPLVRVPDVPQAQRGPPPDFVALFLQRGNEAATAVCNELRGHGFQVSVPNWLQGLASGPPSKATLVIMERPVEGSRVLAFVGQRGEGPWMVPAGSWWLRDAVRRGTPIGLVLLPGTPPDFEAPLFLAGAPQFDARTASVARAVAHWAGRDVEGARAH